MTNTKTNGTIPERKTGIQIGCYIDSHHGIYSIELLYDLVLDLVDPGSLPDDIDDMGVVIQHSLYGDTDARVSAFGYDGLPWHVANEYAAELWDELTELLPADDDRVWMWSDGDLFYASIDDARDEYGAVNTIKLFAIAVMLFVVMWAAATGEPTRTFIELLPLELTHIDNTTGATK